VTKGFEVASQPLLRCPKLAAGKILPASFDRCAKICSFHPLQAAVANFARDFVAGSNPLRSNKKGLPFNSSDEVQRRSVTKEFEVASQPLLRCPKLAAGKILPASFDRCAKICSFHPLQAAAANFARDFVAGSNPLRRQK